MSLTDTFTTTPQSTLKNLVQILHDGRDGFRTASENVKDSKLKAVFSKLSLQRSKFAGELESELLSLGEEDPQKVGGTVSGSIHRTWIDLKSALTSQDDHAVLAEAERGEDSAVKAYLDALEQENIPAPLHDIIVKQATEVKLAHDEVKALRDASKK